MGHAHYRAAVWPCPPSRIHECIREPQRERACTPPERLGSRTRTTQPPKCRERGPPDRPRPQTITDGLHISVWSKTVFRCPGADTPHRTPRNTGADKNSWRTRHGPATQPTPENGESGADTQDRRRNGTAPGDAGPGQILSSKITQGHRSGDRNPRANRGTDTHPEGQGQGGDGGDPHPRGLTPPARAPWPSPCSGTHPGHGPPDPSAPPHPGNPPPPPGTPPPGAP